MPSHHLLLKPDKRAKEKINKLIKSLENNFTLKKDLDAYIINRNPTLEESFSIESGYIKGNKELRYRPVGSKWDTDYEGIPLYNRNSDKFTDKELNKIGDSIKNYFRDKYDIRLISKLIS